NMTSKLNDRIAKAKGWTRSEKRVPFTNLRYDPEIWCVHKYTHWHNPKGKPAPRPDFTGTLEGVAGMLRGLCNREREIGSTKRWYITHTPNGYTCQRAVGVEVWESYTSEQFGLCVGEAWLSVFGEEAADGSTN
ncbi:unnamed protein product, partial [marine sediment metagenome]